MIFIYTTTKFMENENKPEWWSGTAIACYNDIRYNDIALYIVMNLFFRSGID